VRMMKLSPTQSEIVRILREQNDWMTAQQIMDRLPGWPNRLLKNVHVHVHNIRKRGVEIDSEARVGPYSRGYRIWQ